MSEAVHSSRQDRQRLASSQQVRRAQLFRTAYYLRPMARKNPAPYAELKEKGLTPSGATKSKDARREAGLVRLEVWLEPDVAATLDRWCEELQASKKDVIHVMIRSVEASTKGRLVRT